MRIFKPGPGHAPKWGELDFFELVRLQPGELRSFERHNPKEKLIVCAGQCVIWLHCATHAVSLAATASGNLDLPDGADRFLVEEVSEPTTLCYFTGRWGAENGGSGLFGVRRSEHPRDDGDPVNYPKETDFDCHYHDCDEYWIIWEGSGEVVIEDQNYAVAAGDGVAIGMGHHHDFPLVRQPVKAVWFETTLQGQKRRGHLYNHTHGLAQPRWERV